MDSKSNQLADQKNALLDYVDVLITEPAVEKAAPKERYLVERNCRVNSFNASVEDSESVQPEIRDNLSAENIKNTNRNNRCIEVCVFLVSGLKLGISANKIGSIIDIPNEVKLLDQQLQQHVSGLAVNGSSVIAINTSILVMPNRKGRKSTKMIIVKDSNIGFTCDDVIESVNQDKNDICWRTASTKRKWLAGTVVTRQLALLDVDEIIQRICSLQ